ncbi:MAG: hypothetical protein ACKOWJ_05125 [Micrococcales bacterium]
MSDQTSPRNVPQSTWDAWYAELENLGFTNPLRNFERNSFGQIDLASAHPGGFSQFVGGGQTTLSNLVRDSQLFSLALAAAKRIKAKSDQLSSQFGLETLGLLGGLLNLQADGLDYQLPIFFWPVRLNHRPDDFEVELAGPARVNPLLTQVLRENYQIELDTALILKLAEQSSEIMPRSVIEYLEAVIAGKTDLSVQRLLVITTFTTAAIEATRDFSHHSSELISNLASGEFSGVEPFDEAAEIALVADADSTQLRIVRRAVAGHSFAVETLPGCGYTQTVINAITALVAAGKSVVVAAPRVQTLNELADRMAALGLAGLGVRSKSTWLDIVSSISRNEKAGPVSVDAESASLEAAAAELGKYHESLARRDEQLGVSLGQALEQLARLSGMPNAPQTSARIEKDYLVQHATRTRGLGLLQRAADVGAFAFGPSENGWFAANFESAEQLKHIAELAVRIREDDFPSLAKQLGSFAEAARFRQAENVEEWGDQIRLFLGIRETLDRFVSDVFDRPLTELIVATSARKEAGVGRSEMSGGTRRRLKKLAQEYVRPGMHVSDINASLRQIQEQRDAWHLQTTAVTAPSVPTGLVDAQVAYQKFMADLDVLQAHLDVEVAPIPLQKISFGELQKVLDSLADGIGVLATHGERVAAFAELKEAGLEQLGRDLAKRHSKREHLAAEFDLSWWQSALEILVQRDSTVLRFTAEQLDSLESDFAGAGAAVVAKGAAKIAWQLAERWAAALTNNPAVVDGFKQTLRGGQASLLQVFRAARPLYEAVAPVVMVSPLEATRELYGQKFDVALILDAAGTTTAENLAVLRRANQAIFFGDDAIASAEGFEVECHIRPLQRTEPIESIFVAARRAFGVETLKTSYRPFGQVLGSLINREFYQNRIVFEPTAAEFDGKRSHAIEIITEGAKANETIGGSNESPEAELRRVVDLVLNHALWHPDQSLFVASASTAHAERIRSALAKELKQKPDLATFFDAHGREKFEVVGIRDLAHRFADRIIFTVGFGLLPGGGVGNNFGQLSAADGRRYLTNTLVSARKQFTVVSCIPSAQIPADVADGAALLKSLLASAEDGGHQVRDIEGDSLLADLASRLRRLGARVDTGFAQRLPLVIGYANQAAVIMPDSGLFGLTLTEKFRLRPNLLSNLGFKYIRVHSFDLFSDPQAVTIRIAKRLGMPTGQTNPQLFDAERAFEDTDMAWGDRSRGNDEQLRRDVPPHY